MNRPNNIKIAGIFAGITLAFILVFVYPAEPKETQAQLGATLSIKIKDLAKKAEDFKKKYGKWGDIAFQALRKRYLTQIQNDLVNWVQGNGKPRFIKDPAEFLKDNADASAAKELNRFFLSKGVNICSPFRANVRVLVSKPLLLREEIVRCDLGDIADNLKNFKADFKSGGWRAWLKLHETRNTLPGTYLATTELIDAKVKLSGSTAQAQISAGKGFLDHKKCSEIKFPKYVLDFVVEATGRNYTFPIENLELLNRVLAANSPSKWTDDNLWLEITSIPIAAVLPESIEILPTGEFITLDQNLNDPVPPGATCTQEEIVTPGSTVGEWVTGGLEKLHIDTLINAKEFGEIFNAVVDAAINRAAREGLSKLAGGHGSWTQPTKAGGQTYYGQTQVQAPVIGAESTVSSVLLNRVLAFQNNVQRLIIQINSQIRGENTADSFKQKLETRIIPGFNSDSGAITRGDTDDIIDKIYRGKDLNDESRNPGPYIANKILNELIASKWDGIIQTFQNMEPSNSPNLPDSCASEITDVRFFDHPKKEALPFTDGEGKVFQKTSGVNIYYELLTLRSPDQVKDGAVRTTVTAWKNSYLSTRALPRARSNKNLYLNTAQAYTGLIGKTKKLLENLQNDKTGDDDDLEFIDSILPDISRYDSLLTDYDQAARESGAMGALQNYLELRDAAADQLELEILKSTLLTSQRNARNAWLKVQQDIQDNPQRQPDEKAKAEAKEIIIKDAIARVETSLRNLLASHPQELKDSFGLEPAGVNNLSLDIVLDIIARMESIDFVQDSQSVGTATAEVIFTERNISQIETDLSEREGQINTHQTELTDTIGQFLSKDADAESGDVSEKRKELGAKGGDSEWEKYYYNRFQLAYAAYIDDFYKNWFKCPLPPFNSDPLPPLTD